MTGRATLFEVNATARELQWRELVGRVVLDRCDGLSGGGCGLFEGLKIGNDILKLSIVEAKGGHTAALHFCIGLADECNELVVRNRFCDSDERDCKRRADASFSMACDAAARVEDFFSRRRRTGECDLLYGGFYGRLSRRECRARLSFGRSHDMGGRGRLGGMGSDAMEENDRRNARRKVRGGGH